MSSSNICFNASFLCCIFTHHNLNLGKVTAAIIACLESKIALKHVQMGASTQSANPIVIDESLDLIAFAFLIMVSKVGNNVP